MKIAILYTSFRQLAELKYFPRLFAKNRKLLDGADIVYHNNNRDFTPAQIQAALAPIGFKNLKVIYSPQQNVGGYPYGQFEAICDSYQALLDGGYDWVIHLHPDIFIIDENKLLAEIEKAEVAGADMLVCSTFGHKAPAYATDFFCFKPRSTPIAIFESYRAFLTTPIVVPLEYLFFNEIFRAGVKLHVAHRFLHGNYTRDIDQLGLWHEHNLRRIELYLQNPEHRWKTLTGTIFRKPNLALRVLRIWWQNRRKGLPQESLKAQLTRAS